MKNIKRKLFYGVWQIVAHWDTGICQMLLNIAEMP
jgi:hypothetical protein